MPACICLQETLAHLNKITNISGYNMLHSRVTRDDGHERGASLLIHKKINYDLIPLRTDLQAVAAKIYWHKQYTICSLYLPHSDVSKAQIQDLINQLPTPFLILGDFNARNTLWGDTAVNRRGQAIEEVLLENDVILLNSNQPTHFHIQTNTYSNIDLSMASADSVTDFSYNVLEDLHGSDHYPIKIDALQTTQSYQNPIRYNLNKADWAQYKDLTKMNPIAESSAEDILEHIENKIIQAADTAIPTTSPNPRKPPIPWFNEDIKQAIRDRKRAGRALKRNYSIENLIAYKRCRARVKYLCKKARAESWKQFISSINQFTSLNKIWSKTKKISGKFSPKPHPILKVNDEIVDSKTDVANILAETFAAVSSSENYSLDFLRYKNRIESKTLQFDTQENYSYNEPLTIEEVTSCLSETQESAPGIDKITYAMIKNSHPTLIAAILQLYNKIFLEGHYPNRWRTAIIAPIPKPNKDPKDPTNYRPISLTCCLSKLLEKVINTRLMWYLENNNMITDLQNGFRANRSTTDSIVKLENDIHHAMAEGLHTIVVLFDLTKAYDMAWRFGVLKSLHEGGMRGNLPKFIQSFLYDRRIVVRVGDSMSNPKEIQEGILQGSVLSCTCFLLSINSIVTNVDNSVKCSLYVDDFTIYCSGRMPNNVERLLQLTINRLHEWTKKTGYKFSPTKTTALHVCRKRGCLKRADLHYNGTPIETVDSCKYLGVTFDKSLTWRPHILKTKEACYKVLDLLKHLSHKTWGADRISLLRLYNMLVKPKLEYGCEAYAAACKSLLKTLEPIQNRAIRIATGAYRSSPAISLCAESGIKPLSYSRDQKTLNYILRIFTSRNYVLQDLILNHDSETSDNNQFSQKTFISRAKLLMVKYDFDYSAAITQENPNPTWEGNLQSCNELSTVQKNLCSPLEIKATYYNHLETSPHRNMIYTDGSKMNTGVGYAMVHGEHAKSERLLPGSSIFSAELYAIETALDHGLALGLPTITVATDSKSSIQALKSTRSKHEIVKAIRCKSKQFDQGIKLCWTPSHVGIPGNELADKEAKKAISLETISGKRLPNSDYKVLIKHAVRDKWREDWRNLSQNKYRVLTETPNPLSGSSNKNRHWERTLARLRLGHSHLTHSFLMNGDSEPPLCEHCDSPVTVKHALVECELYTNERRICFNEVSPDLKELLTKNSDFSLSPLYRYLSLTQLLYKI